MYPFSIPFVIEVVKGIPNTNQTVVFRDIPPKEDMLKVWDYKESEHFSYPHSFVLKLGTHFILTVAVYTKTNPDKFYLTHESSFLERNTSYLIGKYDGYKELVEHITFLLKQEIDRLNCESSILTKILKGVS